MNFLACVTGLLALAAVLCFADGKPFSGAAFIVAAIVVICISCALEDADKQ